MSEAGRRALVEFSLALLSRLLASPIGWFVRRDPNLWLVIGREHGRFLDNAKYFFSWLHRNGGDGVKVVFLSEDEEVLGRLREAGAAAVRYPGLPAFRVLWRAGTAVFDTTDPIEHGRIGFLVGARVLQIWHGAPLKEIELAVYRRQLESVGRLARVFLRIYKKVLGRYRPCDVLVSTSGYFTERAFAPCLPAKRIVATGYPRNDVLLGGGDYPADLVGINTDQESAERIAGHRRRGDRIVLYAPTFRSGLQSPFRAGKVDLARWSDHARGNGYLLVLKLHPFMRGRYESAKLPRVLDVSPGSDVYPLLRDVNLLITDYSSIFFDYLLLNRPVLFFPYDRAHYIAEDHPLLFDYDAMTPGPKLEDFEELLQTVKGTLTSEVDDWAEARRRVARLTFDDRDARASERIWKALQSNH